MATLVRGKTFGATETVTNTKLHQLVDNGTVSAIIRDDFNLAADAPVNINASAPAAPIAGHVWYDTTTSILRVYDGAKFNPVARGFIYTNNSGDTLNSGDLVVIDKTQDQSVTTTTTAVNLDAFGFVVGTSNDGTDVIVITEGISLLSNVTGATAIGDYLSTSTTAGKADPSTNFASGAFARALTSGSTTVVAQMGITALAQIVGPSDLFEIDSGREPTASVIFGTPTTVSFNGTFAEPPIVICTTESTTPSHVIQVIKVTTTEFTVVGNLSNPFNWIACTAGTFEVSSGVIVQAATCSTNTTNIGHTVVRQTGKTPSIVGSMMYSDDVVGSFNTFAISNRLFGGETNANLNFAGRSSGVTVYTNGNVAGTVTCFILISQTSTTKTSNAVTADGSQGSIGTKNFESGTVVEVTSLTPTLTFQTAFSSVPAVLLSGESRSDQLAEGNYPANHNATPTTGGVTPRLTSVDPRTGYNWFAIDKGFQAVSSAKRLA